MSKRVLITGGAGFIGSHTADELLAHGYRVRVFDNLSTQVHGPDARVPDYLSEKVEFMTGDVGDMDSLRSALRGVDAVFHFAAMVGVGQSMYQVANYTAVNNQGTGNLLQLLTEDPVERLIVASSMSLYGEGLYRNGAGQIVAGTERSLEQLKRRDWEVHGPDGEVLVPLPTPESKPPTLSSVYAL